MKKPIEQGLSWCAAYVRHGAETQAAGSLDALGFETYNPRLGTETVVRGEVRKRWEPMFPRYVLVRLPLASGTWHPAMWAKGVVRLVGPPGGTEPFALRDAEFEALRARCGGDRAEEIRRRPRRGQLKEGDLMRIATGPWASFEGPIGAFPARDRVIVMLSVFGRRTEVEFRETQVERVDRRYATA